MHADLFTVVRIALFVALLILAAVTYSVLARHRAAPPELPGPLDAPPSDGRASQPTTPECLPSLEQVEAISTLPEPVERPCEEPCPDTDIGPPEGIDGSVEEPSIEAPLALPPDRTAAICLRRAPGQTRHPIVLVHGLLGFDSIQIAGRRHEYFRGIRGPLRRLGSEIHILEVSPLSSIAVRATDLAEQIRRLQAERVNIVAHSMGGLDARYAISELGLSSRVASLTTIGTPHRGTPIADLASLLLRRLARVPSMAPAFEAIWDLSMERMEEFNRRFEDAPGVSYTCFVASIKGGARRVSPPLLPGYFFLSRQAGDNDGLVPVVSQRWGDVLGEIDVDHWGQVGWARGFDAVSFYEGVVHRLAERGF